MSQPAHYRKSPPVKPKPKAKPAAPAKSRTGHKERVLIEFPAALLQRADQAARGLETNRSDLIRNAVERLLDEMESRELERELAAAYAANAEMNRALALEFKEVDREGFR